MPVGNYDPDHDEQPAKRPAWSKPKTPLAVRLLKACRRKYFSSREERKKWNIIEGKTIGENDDSFLHRKWVEKCIGEWEVHNKNGLVRILPALLSYMDNDDRRNDWIAKNKAEILKNRKKEGLSDLETKLLSFKEK